MSLEDYGGSQIAKFCKKPEPPSSLTMTSSNGNIFRVTGPLLGKFTFTKASDAELWYFLGSAPEQTAKQTIETRVIWDAIALIMTSP